MIIDLILDRQDGKKYSPAEFYRDVMQYSGIFSDITAPITRALDYGTEDDVKAALAEYVRENEYSPAIVDYINSVNWLDGPTLAADLLPAVQLAADLEKLAHDMDPFGYDADDARYLVDDITAGSIEYIADGLATIAADDCNCFEYRARAAELLARLLRMFA